MHRDVGHRIHPMNGRSQANLGAKGQGAVTPIGARALAVNFQPINRRNGGVGFPVLGKPTPAEASQIESF